MKIISVQIINPDTKAPVSLEDWKKESDPTRAEWLLIETDELKPFLLHKRLADGGQTFTFDQAYKKGNRLTIAQGHALYEARNTTDIDAILELISGDPLGGVVWTSEACSAPRGTAHAWFVGLNLGRINHDTKISWLPMRIVSDKIV